jgi:hypothetical protein
MHGGRVVDPGFAARQGSLVLYRLPSGNEVVGTYDNLLADSGVLADAFDERQREPSGDKATELFIIKLPSGLGIVATYDECIKDGGTVMAKIQSRTQKHLG